MDAPWKVDASAAAPVASDLDVHAMAALGLAGVTAFEGLRRLGPLDERRIAVTGAAGGVGSAAVDIAKAQGAQVAAIISRPWQTDYVRALGATEVILAREIAKGALGNETVDGILDTVAGEFFGAGVAALRPKGTLSLIGAVGGSNVSLDAYLPVNVTLTGYNSESLDGLTLRRAIGAIGLWLRRGVLVAPARTLFPLAEAAAAHESLESHSVRGRVLLVPGST